MPVLAVSLAIAQAMSQQSVQVPHSSFRIDGELVVEARSATFNRTSGESQIPDRMEFKDGVRAIYGEDVLTADSLVIFPKERRGEASGNVVLSAVEGTLSAENLVFSWAEGARSASASNIRLETGGVLMHAARLETVPGDPPTLILHDVYGSACGGESRPALAVRSSRVIFVPGKSGSIHRPQLVLFGKKIVTLPTSHFNLDPRVKGVSLPAIYSRPGKGLGARWDAGFLLDDQTAASADAQYFPGSPFRMDVSVTRSYLAPQKSTSLITPRSDFEERFHESYLQNIEVKTPLGEDNRLSSDRRTLSLASSLNHGTSNDRSSDSYTKAIEIVYETGGTWRGLGLQTSTRLQHVRRNDEAFTSRAVAQSSLSLPSVRISDGLYLRGRLDSAAFLGETTFGWARAEGSLVIAPARWLLLGAGYVAGTQYGSAMFPADRLPARHAIAVRIDADLGPTKISYLWKRNLDTRELLTEYSASQAMGCVEAFVSYREFPSSYQLGLKLRIDAFLRPLRSRDVRRTKSLVPVDPRIGPASGLKEPPAKEQHH